MWNTLFFLTMYLSVATIQLSYIVKLTHIIDPSSFQIDMYSFLLGY